MKVLIPLGLVALAVAACNQSPARQQTAATKPAIARAQPAPAVAAPQPIRHRPRHRHSARVLARSGSDQRSGDIASVVQASPSQLQPNRNEGLQLTDPSAFVGGVGGDTARYGADAGAYNWDYLARARLDSWHGYYRGRGNGY